LRAEPSKSIWSRRVARRRLQLTGRVLAHQFVIALIEFLAAKCFSDACAPAVNPRVPVAVRLIDNMPVMPQRLDHGETLAHSAMLPQGSLSLSSVSRALIAASSLRTSHRTRPYNRYGFGILPSLTARSNSVGLMPTYFAASVRESPRGSTP